MPIAQFLLAPSLGNDTEQLFYQLRTSSISRSLLDDVVMDDIGEYKPRSRIRTVCSLLPLYWRPNCAASKRDTFHNEDNREVVRFRVSSNMDLP